MSRPRVYCTLFDRNYLDKALAMYRSLEQHAGPFRLIACTFDRRAEELLARLELAHLDVVALRDLEAHDPDLRAVKDRRTPVEYCWTATPALPLYVMETRRGLDEVTYVDADLRFFGDPSPIFAEMGNASVLITPHRYAPEYAHHATSGIYNVQFLTFRRTEEGLRALRWWRERCLEWCHARLENARFGDQKYLDDWPDRFAAVHVLRHIGAGAAPWNVLQYDMRAGPDGTVTVDGTPLIFFHFHGLRLRRSGRDVLHPPGYHVPKAALELVYRPYLDDLAAARAELAAVDRGFQEGLEDDPPLARRLGDARVRAGETVLRRFPALARVRYPNRSSATP